MDTTHRRIARTLHRELCGPEGYGVERLARETGLSSRTIYHWTADEASPTLADVLRVVAQVAEEDAARANRIVDGLVAIVGMEARPAPTLTPDAPPAILALNAAAETGDVQRWAAEALADGEIDYVEASAGDRACRGARHALDRLHAAVRGAAEQTPQLALDGGRP